MLRSRKTTTTKLVSGDFDTCSVFKPSNLLNWICEIITSCNVRTEDSMEKRQRERERVGKSAFTGLHTPPEKELSFGLT